MDNKQVNASRVITVFGSSAIRPGDKEYELAEQLGGALAHAGYAVCNGGYMGSMEACAKGASEAGGEAIGVTTNDFATRTPNPFLSRELRQASLIRRIDTLVRTGDAFVVLPGGVGTLAELMVVWNLSVNGRLPGKPLYLFGSHYKRVVEFFSSLPEIEEKHLRYLEVVTSVDSLLQRLQEYFSRLDAGRRDA